MELVTVNNGSPVTTTLAIADGLEVQHKNIMELVRKHQADLEEFGRVAFQTLPLWTAGGMQNSEIAELNERQATLIMTYSKNTEIARTFKKRLVKTFYEMASKTTAPATPELQIANAMLLAGRMIEEQKLQIEQRDKLISITAPKAAIADKLVISDGLYNLTLAAKLMDCQPRQFNKDLNARGWIYRMGNKGTWTGYSKPTKDGYLDHKIHQFEHTDGRPDTSAQVFITAKGMHKLASIYNVEFAEAV